MTYDEVVERTVAIMRDLYELKERIHRERYGVQPDFDAGILEAAIAILDANVDADDPRVKAEHTRRINDRLLWALQERNATRGTPDQQETTS